jgi:catechol 2,3-dioxygenase-like lactoylglutathione lyase family enzyme
MTDSLPVRQVRFARPTDNLDAVLAFYRDRLGLAELGKFEDHDGYSGVMLGPPGERWHLEFTHNRDGSPCPAPTHDNLLVLYFDDAAQTQAVGRRLEAYGGCAVPAENPYWTNSGAITLEDPDGWRVVLMPQRSF